ncbi:MAG: Gldg family protein, partial [Actinomycetota bacterium]
AVLVAIDLVADRSSRTFDLTADQSLTLTDQTREIVDHIDDRVRITAFLPRQLPGRAEASALLTRYRKLNRRIAFDLKDPAQAPAEVRRHDLDPTLGGVVYQMGSDVETSSIVTEQDVTSALARLLRGPERRLCMTSGHGEADPTSPLDEGWSSTAEQLAQNGYRVEVVDLLTQPSVPRRCEVLVLADPRTELQSAGDTIAEYLEEGGDGLVLTDPESTVDLDPLLRPYGVRVVRGITLEGDAGSRLPDDPISVIVRDYAAPNPIIRGLGPTLFPAVEALLVESRETEGLSAVSLLHTTESSYMERDPPEFLFQEGRDLPGPITIAAAVDQSSVVAGEVKRTRLVVFADSDFATNAFLPDGSNSRLLVQALDWVTLEENLVTVSANLPRLRELDMTADRTRYARLLGAGIVPSVFLLAGALVWAVRRSR